MLGFQLVIMPKNLPEHCLHPPNYLILGGPWYFLTYRENKSPKYGIRPRRTSQKGGKEGSPLV